MAANFFGSPAESVGVFPLPLCLPLPLPSLSRYRWLPFPLPCSIRFRTILVSMETTSKRMLSPLSSSLLRCKATAFEHIEKTRRFRR